MRKEMNTNIPKMIKDGFKVPDLIGDFCPYSTFGHFMSAFHKSTTSKIIKHTDRLGEISNFVE